MQITTKLTMAYLKKNKKRTLGTIFAVTIVTILITILLTIFSSYQHFKEYFIRDKGNWEAEFLCVKYSDALEIAKDENIKETSIWYDYGLCDENLGDTKTSYTRIHLWGYDENKIKNSGFYLTEGRMPENSNEIVIPEKGQNGFEANFKRGKKIGDKIEMTFEGEKKIYTIVGFVEVIEEGTQSKNIIDGKDIRIGAITFLDTSALKEETIVYADVIAKNKRKIYETAQKLEKNLNLAEIQNIRKVTMINRDELEKVELTPEEKALEEAMNQLIGAMGGSRIDRSDPNVYEEPMPTDKVIYNEKLLETIGITTENIQDYEIMNIAKTYKIYVIASFTCTFVIALAGIVLILTSFTITYRERVTEFERLSSLGMSNRQRRMMCLKEGLIIGTFGIIIGILSGTIMSAFIINMVQKTFDNYIRYSMFTETIHTAFTMYFPLQTMITVGIIIYISVAIATILPLRKLKKIDIVSGIKGNRRKRLKNKKTPFVISKLFKQEGVLAYKYTKREKARHANMVTCITVSVLLFLIINGIVGNFLDNEDKLTYDDYKINCTIDLVDKVTNYLDEHNLARGYFIQTDALYFKEGTKTSYSDFKVEVPKEKISDVMLQLLNENKQSMGVGISFPDLDKMYYSGESYNFTVLPYYFNEKAYNEILERVGLTELKENECILVNKRTVENSAFGDSVELTKYEKRGQYNCFGC